MKILVEGHSYDAMSVSDICGDFEIAGGGKIKVTKVGYYFNPRINDCVLCLPKVFSDASGGSVLGGLKPEDLIDAFSSGGSLGEEQAEFVRSLSLWTYRTISTYSRLNPDSTIVTRTGGSESSGDTDAANGTILDVVLSIMRFYHANRDYYMYIVRDLHSGYERVNWKKTIQNSTPAIVNGRPCYVNVVNKKKQIDFDEELMVIFYSILHYISSELGLSIDADCNYELITGAAFESYIDGLGIGRLDAIRYKYFSDKDRQLWSLCYAFFLSFSKIREKDEIGEYLLIGSFEIVFESMMDALISDADLPDVLKNQKDGKIVDHIFKYRSPVDGRDIYYIGDSKYYSIGSTIGDNSIYKQFTYAKNIIQYHFIRSVAKKLDETGYRDQLTEGYNFTPNFFISAFIPDTLTFRDSAVTARSFPNKSQEDGHRVFHFENRLFDRDTLWLTHFDINLLYVMALYAGDDSSEQHEFKSGFRKKVLEATKSLLSLKYDFFHIIPHAAGISDFVEKHFRLLYGKIYMTREGVLMLALEKGFNENGKIMDEISKSADCFRISL